MHWNRTSPPTSEPLSATEVKTHLRVDSDLTADDTLIAALIRAAREQVEAMTNREFIASTYVGTLDAFPGGDILLPRPPLIAVSSVAYLDSGGASQTLTETTDYVVYPAHDVGRIALAYGTYWPSTYAVRDAVMITWTAGYATPFTAAVPASTPPGYALTASGRTIVDAEVVRLTNTGGALPAGLAADTDYWVIDLGDGTFSLAASAADQGDGTAVEITDAGTGTHFLGEVPAPLRQAMLLLIGHWYSQREPVAPVELKRIPWTIENLCAPYVVLPLD